MNTSEKKPETKNSMTALNKEQTTAVTENALTPLGLVNSITDLSKKIYELAELAKFIHYKDNIKNWRIYSTEEVAQAIDSLLFAKGYLGKLMGELGTPTPYQNDGKRNSVNDIEPVANSSTPDFSSFRSLNLVQKVDKLREDIQNILNVDILILSNDSHTIGGVDLNDSSKRKELYLNQSFIHLTAAKMWLGFELGRIRESK